jgi:serine/threonine-protein kinase
MAKDPRERYQSATEMRQDIQRALQGVPVAAPRTAAYGTATQRVGPAAAMAGVPTGAMPGYQYGQEGDGYPPEPPERRWLPIVLWIAGILVVLGVVGGVAYAILGGGSSGHAVPQVNGLTLAQAEHQITAAGLKYKVQMQPSSTVAKNIVISTSPPNGNVVPAGSQVVLVVSSGPKMAKVPDVRHDSVSQAQSTLKAAGFVPSVQTDNSSTGKPGTVVRQDPAAGTKVKYGSTVTIFVPPNGNLVPAVVGQQYDVAIGNLNNAGFTNIARVTVINPQLANGTVTLQNPKAGSRVPPGTQITLSVVQNPASPSPSPSPTPSATPTPTSTVPPG